MKTMKNILSIMFALLLITACADSGNNWGPDGPPKTFAAEDFKGKKISMLTGTMLDEIMTENIPGVIPVYFDNDTDGISALINGKVDAHIADDALIKLFVTKTPGLRMIEPFVTQDDYGLVVAKENLTLQLRLNEFIAMIKADGTHAEMIDRWLNSATSPQMPLIPEGENGIIILGTTGLTDGFSYYFDGELVGFDIEFAKRFAAYIDKKLQMTVMDFGGMIPAVISGKVDFAASCITITDERKKSVGFSDPYYTGGAAIAVYEKP